VKNNFLIFFIVVVLVISAFAIGDFKFLSVTGYGSPDVTIDSVYKKGSDLGVLSVPYFQSTSFSFDLDDFDKGLNLDEPHFEVEVSQPKGNLVSDVVVNSWFKSVSPYKKVLYDRHEIVFEFVTFFRSYTTKFSDGLGNPNVVDLSVFFNVDFKGEGVFKVLEVKSFNVCRSSGCSRIVASPIIGVQVPVSGGLYATTISFMPKNTDFSQTWRMIVEYDEEIEVFVSDVELPSNPDELEQYRQTGFFEGYFDFLKGLGVSFMVVFYFVVALIIGLGVLFVFVRFIKK